VSIVRDNLMNRAGYSPYCGAAAACRLGMHRTHFVRDQFECGCGWRSNFDAEFIAAYKAKWHQATSASPSGSPTDHGTPIVQPGHT
jgi:hypothetical protein